MKCAKASGKEGLQSVHVMVLLINVGLMAKPRAEGMHHAICSGIIHLSLSYFPTVCHRFIGNHCPITSSMYNTMIQ